jgi:protoporphyrinogen oxidase
LQQKRVVVVGGGLSGLAASYDLARAGWHVTLVEAAKDLGGLASSVKIEGTPVERFYHFICRRDEHLMQLIGELGLEDKLSWQRTRTSFFHEGRYYRFGSPLDLLRFTAIPPAQRLRFGVHILLARFRESWQFLDQMPAKPWLIEWIGREAYEVIWHPLLKVKFGDYHDKVSAAWIWHRIWRIAASRNNLFEGESFGCLEHGTATIVEALVDRLRKLPNVEIALGQPVQPLALKDNKVSEVSLGGRALPADAVISTVALPQLDRLAPGQTDPYFERARKVEYIGVVCMMLVLDRPFGPYFWTNINDRRVSFNGVIEQSNLNVDLKNKGINIVYVPFYIPTTDRRYKARDEELFDEYCGMLKLLNEGFDRSWVKEWHVFRAAYAQPIFTTNFLELMPDHRTPVHGLYVTDSTQFYPEDRTISAAIAQGRKVAKMILQDQPTG